MYLDAQHQNKKFYEKLFLEHPIDVVYFNSLFSIKFTLLPFWILKNKPIRRVLATRGMLGKGALAIKPLKKKLFLTCFKLMKLHKKVIWHATAPSEADEIKTHFGENRTILLAPNLSAILKHSFVQREKQQNQISIFFLSRIAVKKNLVGALNLLENINRDHKVHFTIIGPIDDKAYWKKCMLKIKSLPKHIEVNYKGAIPNHELAEHLKHQHLLLLPTYGENFGHVIMESWQNGCPVLISDQTPWRNLKQDKLGFDIAIDNENDFIESLEYFSAMSQSEFSEWSKSAYNYADQFIKNPKVLEQNKALFLNA